MVAIAASSLVRMAAFATDAGTWYLARRNAQNVADAAALGAVRVLADSRTGGNAATAGQTFAGLNGFTHG